MMRTFSPVLFAAASALCVLLAGCNAAGVRAPASLVMAPDVPVTVVAIDGAPDSLRQALELALTDAAARRSVRLVEADASPAYEVRGYFSAAPDGAGTALSYAWDVQDTANGSAERVEGSTQSPRQAADPWAVADRATLAAFAEQSMNGLAGHLARRTAPAPAPATSTAPVTAPATAPPS